MAIATTDLDPPAAARPAFRATKKRPWGRILFLLAVAGIVAVVVAGRLRPKPVTVTPLARGTAVDAVYATGSVEALDRVVVKAKTSGSLLELKVKEGDKVKKGDLLAIIDSPTLKFELAKGKADLWAASSQAGTSAPQIAVVDAQIKATQAQIDNAKSDRDRLVKLVASGTATQVELDKATTALSTLESTLAAQQAQRKSLLIDLGARAQGSSAAVDSLTARLSDTEVRAPMDGVVLGKNVELGEVVMLNQPLLRLGSVDRLVLECPIDEADIGRVTLGKPAAVSLYAFPGRTFNGVVFEILPDADRSKKSFLTKIKLTDAPAGLRSGMSAEVNVIIEERKNALLGPAEAIDAQGFAWVVTNGRVEKRKLGVGVRDMLHVEILGGAGDGDQVVVLGAELLAPGTKVAPTVKLGDPNVQPSARPKAGI